jgi:hypothetical protein
MRVEKNPDGVWKRNLMLAQVGFGFRRIPLEFHVHSNGTTKITPYEVLFVATKQTG